MGLGKRFIGFLLGMMLTLTTAPAFAQGCIMCYESAKGAPKDGQRALSRAILILLVPPLSAMTFGVGMALRYGRQRDREKEISGFAGSGIQRDGGDDARDGAVGAGLVRFEAAAHGREKAD
jgi:hypothetical protein